MAEQTTPATPEVAPEAPASIDDKLANILGMGDDESQAAETPADEAASAEDDLPIDEEPAPQDDGEELIHNGQSVRVSKEEMRDLAQKGFDYTQKTQTLAEQMRQVHAFHRTLQAAAQVRPVVVDSLANVRMYEQALRNFERVDWVAEATADPLGYQEKKARFDVLRDQYGQAVQYYQSVTQQTDQIDAQAKQEYMAVESQKLLQKIPEWRDRAKWDKDFADIVSSLKSDDITDEELPQLIDSRYMVIARKAMLYDRAVRNRKEKQGQLNKAAPVATPGAPSQTPTKAQRSAEISKMLKRTDNKEMRDKLINEKLALKFNIR